MIEIFLVLFHVKQFFGVLYHNLLKPLLEGGRLQVFWITQKLKKNGKNKRFFFSKKLKDIEIKCNSKNKLSWEKHRDSREISLATIFSRHVFFS